MDSNKLIRIIGIYGIIIGVLESIKISLSIIYQNFGLPESLVKILSSILGSGDIIAGIYLLIFIAWIIASIKILKYANWAKILLEVLYSLSVIVCILILYRDVASLNTGFSMVSTWQLIYIPLLIIWHGYIAYVLLFKKEIKKVFNKS